MPKTAVDILEDLQAAGFGEKEAKAVVRAVASLTTGELTTKTDLLETKGELKDEISLVRGELKNDIAQLRGELKNDIAQLRGELKNDIAVLREELKNLEIRLIKWYIATSLVLAGTVAMIVALVK